MLANLPNPGSYQSFKPKAPVITYQEKNYDLNEEIKKLKLYRSGVNQYFELVKMFRSEFIGELNYQYNPVLKAVKSDMVRVASYINHYKDKWNHTHTHSSIAILLYDESKKLKAVSIRRYRKSNGEIVKWYKVRGSKAGFIPYRLRDEYSFCFVAFGTAEALIFNILGLDYFILQSDSIAYHIDKNPYFEAFKEKLQGKNIFILPDYDESGFKAANALKNHLKAFSKPQVIEFYKLVNNPAKGFDFRDYVLMLQDESLIIENLLNLLKRS